MNMRAIFGSAIFALALVGAQASAQSDQQQQGQGQVAANETKRVGDWMVRCFPVKSIMPCDMIYVLAVKQTGRPVLQMRLAYVPSQDKHVMTIGVPLGVALGKGLVVQTTAGSTAPMPFVHCDQSGCFVETIMDNNSIDTLAHAGKGSKLVFSVFNGKPIGLPFPLNGFTEARDTMVQLARGHAGGAPAPAKPAAPAKP
jgi:invasion protein IalB